MPEHRNYKTINSHFSLSSGFPWLAPRVPTTVHGEFLVRDENPRLGRRDCNLAKFWRDMYVHQKGTKEVEEHEKGHTDRCPWAVPIPEGLRRAVPFGKTKPHNKSPSPQMPERWDQLLAAMISVNPHCCSAVDIPCLSHWMTRDLRLTGINL